MTEEGVSFIIPVRNGASRLPSLLNSIRMQTYPQELVDIVVVDDDSTDATSAVAKSYGCRVITHCSRDCERGKAIGLEAALHDVVVFIDDDNILLGDDWLRVALRLVQSSSNVAAQPARFAYYRHDTAANRYQSIFGGTDPIVSYLGRRDRLYCWSKNWNLAGTVIAEDDDAWIVKISPFAVPTLGAQGFVARKSLLTKTVCSPLYFHIDVCAALVDMGLERFAMLKRPIVHNHCTGFGQMLGKMRRNFHRFLRDERNRTYRYDVPLIKKVRAGLIVATGVIPTVTAVRAFLATKDPVSFMHPIVCMATVTLYAYETLLYIFESARVERQSV